MSRSGGAGEGRQGLNMEERRRSCLDGTLVLQLRRRFIHTGAAAIMLGWRLLAATRPSRTEVGLAFEGASAIDVATNFERLKQ